MMGSTTRKVRRMTLQVLAKGGAVYFAVVRGAVLQRCVGRRFGIGMSLGLVTIHWASALPVMHLGGEADALCRDRNINVSSSCPAQTPISKKKAERCCPPGQQVRSWNTVVDGRERRIGQWVTTVRPIRNTLRETHTSRSPTSAGTRTGPDQGRPGRPGRR